MPAVTPSSSAAWTSEEHATARSTELKEYPASQNIKVIRFCKSDQVLGRQ
jgi:hypothetical protein